MPHQEDLAFQRPQAVQRKDGIQPLHDLLVGHQDLAEGVVREVLPPARPVDHQVPVGIEEGPVDTAPGSVFPRGDHQLLVDAIRATKTQLGAPNDAVPVVQDVHEAHASRRGIQPGKGKRQETAQRRRRRILRAQRKRVPCEAQTFGRIGLEGFVVGRKPQRIVDVLRGGAHVQEELVAARFRGTGEQDVVDDAADSQVGGGVDEHPVDVARQGPRPEFRGGVGGDVDQHQIGGDGSAASEPEPLVEDLVLQGIERTEPDGEGAAGRKDQITEDDRPGLACHGQWAIVPLRGTKGRPDSSGRDEGSARSLCGSAEDPSTDGQNPSDRDQ